jgi:DNA-binding NarL/FixJ family response regulator
VTKKTVLLVDDHPLVRRGLTISISDQPDLTVCGEAATIAEALKAAHQHNPDIAIVDLSLGAEDGLDLIKDLAIRSPKTRVLVLSMHPDSVYAERALRAGAMGYVMKQAAAKSVIDAIHQVLDGRFYLDASVNSAILFRAVQQKAPASVEPEVVLSDRELHVFRLIGRGMDAPAIASSLHVTVKTVETYRERIKQKLHYKNYLELVQQAALWLRKTDSLPTNDSQNALQSGE